MESVLITQILFLLLLARGLQGKPNAVRALKMDQALLTVNNDLKSGIKVSYISDHCYKCLFQPLLILSDGPSNASVPVSTRFTLTLSVETDTGDSAPCRWSQLYGQSGRYAVRVQLSGYPDNITCVRTVDKEPINSYLPLLAAAVLLLLLAVLFVSTPYLYRWLKRSKFNNFLCCRRTESSLDCDVSCSGDVEQTKPVSSRLRSLDTFRGLSLIVMVFVNYGGGRYWFFQHAPWNGLTVADFVMPWFVFIMGTSVVLAFSSLRRKGVSSLQLLRKLTWRSAVLILIGFCFINYSPRDGLLSWSWARVPGVLQRLGFTYFILGLMQILSPGRNVPQEEEHRWWTPLKDVVLYWPQWVFIILLEAVWLCITFLLPVPGCPTGYVGAGGLGDGGLYPNCTGGAAGYIDRWLLGDNIYRHPTCKELYRTTQPFDPEGVLGTINSVVMGFTGMQAGKILLLYRKRNSCILKRFLIWATLLGAVTAALTKCTRDGGFIPVNKNLWSLSYITCMGFTSFLLLALMYVLIDIQGWWAGQPFIYPGMNSIFVYVGHSLLGAYFPFSWEMRFTGEHWEALFQSLWGTSLWVCIAYLLYRKSFFLKI